MSDSDPDPLQGLLSNFALGPSWAKSTDKPARTPKSDDSRRGRDEAPAPRDDRRQGQGQGQGQGNRDRDGQDRRGDGRRNFQGGRNFQDRRNGPPQREEIAPAVGVRVTLQPDAQAVHLIGKEVHQVARVYPLYDVAQILLAERSRCRAQFDTDENRPPFFLGLLDESLFLTREEALHHLWESDLRGQLLEEETIEAEPPTGNFQSVARCGISGEWLGPPNFHSYQKNLRRLHRERFSNMPFEVYSSKVRTERGEEAVNAWLETTKVKTRWRLKGEEEALWLDDRTEAERALSANGFAKAFKETRKAEVSAALPGKNLSPALLASLRIAGSHARKHPAILIPAVCRALEAEHLPVFKRQGKLHTGPARPHALAPDAVLAERPGKMVGWIRDNKPAKLAGLWQAVLPEGSTAPPAEYAADLFWLLQQGHILLYTDDTLVVQEVREPTPAAEPKKKKAKGPKPEKDPAAKTPEPVAAEVSEPASEAPAETEAPADAPQQPVAEAEEPLAEPVAVETPEVSSEEQASIENIEPAPEPEPTPEPAPTAETPAASEPESTPEPEPATAEDGKLPDEDFAEPSEKPQKPD